jgi:5-deoxy-D-glucuronate isomerase
MKSTVDKYKYRLENGNISPIVDVNKLGSVIVFDPKDETVPLQVIGFGVYKLNGETYEVKTEEKEYAFIPVEGNFTIETEDGTFKLDRIGGPFAPGIDESNASALYIPKESYYKITGNGEIVYYTAPSSKKMKVTFIDKGEKENFSRGDLSWRRNVITMIEPGVSTNLVIGETFSPPALWSGTPLHIHDVNDPSIGESEHEEIYYHLSRLKGGEMHNFTVQLLFNGKDLNKAYLCPDRTAMAIPGCCHPVVASPVSDCIYFWGLAGVEGHLGMRDVKEFAYMKKIGEFEKSIRKEFDNKATIKVSRSYLEEFKKANLLNEFQTKNVELILHEYGIDFTKEK